MWGEWRQCQIIEIDLDSGKGESQRYNAACSCIAHKDTSSALLEDCSRSSARVAKQAEENNLKYIYHILKQKSLKKRQNNAKWWRLKKERDQFQAFSDLVIGLEENAKLLDCLKSLPQASSKASDSSISRYWTTSFLNPIKSKELCLVRARSSTGSASSSWNCSS